MKHIGTIEYFDNTNTDRDDATDGYAYLNSEYPTNKVDLMSWMLEYFIQEEGFEADKAIEHLSSKQWEKGADNAMYIEDENVILRFSFK